MELLSAVPLTDPGKKRHRQIQEGETTGAMEAPSGCTFHPRCPVRIDVCDKDEPELKDRGDGHFVACHMEGCKIRCTNLESEVLAQ
jgi:oligopeptide/dipeptide ABC transporter ATP-binding protein